MFDRRDVLLPVLALSVALLLSGVPAMAKAPVGQTANSSAGQVGQRQARAKTANMQTMGRIANRIDNRVDSRLHNRMDRDYNAGVNAAAQLENAGAQARVAGRTTRR